MKKKTKIIIGAVGGLSAAVIGTFGVIMYNQAKYIGDQPSLYGVQMASIPYYNSQFEYYLGKNVYASKVIGLINLVGNNNKTDGAYSIITLIGIDSIEKVDNMKKYNALVEKYDENGVISQIRIEEVDEQ